MESRQGAMRIFLRLPFGVRSARNPAITSPDARSGEASAAPLPRKRAAGTRTLHPSRERRACTHGPGTQRRDARTTQFRTSSTETQTDLPIDAVFERRVP